MRKSAPKRIADYFESEARSGVLLMAAALLALLWANSPWSSAHFSLWDRQVAGLSLKGWVNDGLMALFFLLVGLEIKRELLIGELSTKAKATLPMVAALGGMVVPALIFLAFNAGQSTVRGWGIPMATDIAFALGVLAIAGPRIPQSLRVFLAALAIVDDLGAVLVIALFYSSNLVAWAFGGMAACMALLLVMNRVRVKEPLAYLAIGLPLWYFTHASGVHATIAGVLLAATVPTFKTDADWTPVERLEHGLGPWIRIAIVPLFALANAGVSLSGLGEGLGSPLALGVLFGLVVGKPVGILLACWIAVKARFAVLPERVGKRLLLGAALLAGIGFTMSLFITELAYDESGSLQIAKVSILLASLATGAPGFVWLRMTSRRTFR